MRLLVIRHAPAGDREAWRAAGKDDRARPLTAAGRRKMREAARGLARVVPRPAAVGTSPLVRARQTARLAARALGAGQAEEVPALSPGRAPRALLPWLEAKRGVSLAAVVGHEPHLGLLVGWLLTGSSRRFLTLKKGGACLIDLGERPAPGRAELVWMLAPAQLRRMGR